jgi:dipeptidyl aminopeptidase/acylaminoacyl peptidase
VSLLGLCVPTLAQAGASGAECDRLYATDDQLWVLRAGGPAQLLLSDAAGVLQPRWSRSGEKIAYAREFRFADQKPWSEVVIAGARGQTIRTLPIEAEWGITALLQLGWRGEDRVFVEGHVNPSTSRYLEWDVGSGRPLANKLGSWFAPSPDGRRLAQRAHVPHGAPQPHDGSLLLIDDRAVYPPPDHAEHHFVGGFAWSDDGSRLAFAERRDKLLELVVLKAAEGALERRGALGDVVTPERLTFLGGSPTLVFRDRQRYLRFDIPSGMLSELRQAPDILTRAGVPEELAGRGLNEALLNGDIRCRDR